MANFEDFLSNFPYPASYLAFAHKDSSEVAFANKKNCHPWPSMIPKLQLTSKQEIYALFIREEE